MTSAHVLSTTPKAGKGAKHLSLLKDLAFARCALQQRDLGRGLVLIALHLAAIEENRAPAKALRKARILLDKQHGIMQRQPQ